MKGDPLGRVLFVLVHLCIFCPITTIHPTCVFPLLADDTNIVGIALDVVFIFFMIVAIFFNIRVFSVVDEMCSLVSIRVGPLYITFS